MPTSTLRERFRNTPKRPRPTIPARFALMLAALAAGLTIAPGGAL